MVPFINRITLLGQVRGQPTTRPSGTKPVCNFELTTRESWMGRNGEERREAVHVCVAFGQVAANLASAREGDYVYVEGAMRAERDGADEYAYEVVCFVAVPVAAAEVPA